MSPLKALLTYVAAYRLRVAAGLACILATNILKAVGPVIIQRAVDSVSHDAMGSTLAAYTGLIVAVAAVQGTFLVGQEWTLFGLARCVEHDVRNDFYEILQKLPLEFYQANRIGDLMARATSDVSAAAAGTGHSLIYSVNTIFALMVLLPVMTRLSWRLTAMTFVPLLLVIVATLILKPRIKASSYKTQEYFGVLSSKLEETLAAFRTILAFTQENSETEKFRQINHQYTSHRERNIRLVWLLYPLLQFLIGLAYIGALWHGGRLAAAGKLSVGQFLQFILYVGYLSWPMHEMGTAINTFQRGMAAMTRVHAVMSTRSVIHDRAELGGKLEIKGRIEFRNLTFTHAGARRPALDQLSVQINPDQIVALVGAVGSGKSTFMNMIPRMFDADAGKVLIDGRPVQEFPLNVLRSFIGYVPQEPFLFNTSIAANIGFGKQDTTRQEIEEAAAAADIAGEIEAFPHGYETIVGEKGVLLSGGQRQRISIARAIIRRPRLLLLDDALSAVDAETEARILRYLQRVMQGRTCLMSSHRLSTLRRADWIIVLDRGRVTEQGRHDELMAREGTYERIYREQLLQDELVAS